MSRVTVLLPPADRFGGQRFGEATARMLGRADVDHVEGPLLQRMFDILPRGWPVAAVTRQADAGDAAGATWLRADPAHVRPDINGARLLAHGPALALTAQDVAAFLPALRPLFGDFGCPIDAPVPARWYLRLPAGARLPDFSPPDEALGDELFDHLPGAPGIAGGTEGRRWRALLSETQVVLHNHPRNAERAAAGLPVVNSLWFWGAGCLPDHVRTPFGHVASDDDAVRSFAAAAGAAQGRVATLAEAGASADRLLDLRDARDLKVLEARWLEPLLGQVRAGELGALLLDGADGLRFTIRRNQRWRFWRRPRPQPVA